MATIPIKDGKKITKTDFETAKELFLYLREKLNPLQLYLIDDEDLSEDSLRKIKQS